jgi:glutamyl-tRNA reductase
MIQGGSKLSEGIGEPLLWAFSINHRRASIGMREHLKATGGGPGCFRESLGDLGELIEEHLLLDTCNRWELYVVLRHRSHSEVIKRGVARHFRLTDLQLEQVGVEYWGSRMIFHLFEVCAGVDSQIVGETEILGQVKQAYHQAVSEEAVSLTLNRVFTKAFQSAKWVRTHTAIGKGQVSIGNVAVDLALRIFGDLNRCDALIVGSGEVGRITAQAFKNRQVRALSFMSRNPENAECLAETIGGKVCRMEELESMLSRHDIIVCCTAAPGFLLPETMLRSVMKRRGYRPLFLIDLAMPRDVDPDASRIPQVFLYNLDDVAAIANENLGTRSTEITESQKILSARSWVTWLEVMRRYRMRHLREGVLTSDFDEA